MTEKPAVPSCRSLRLPCVAVTVTSAVLCALYLYGPVNIPTSPSWLKASFVSSVQCHDVLHNMLTGSWHQRNMTSEEEERMKELYRKAREEQLNIPRGNQRDDKRCGNISVGPGRLMMFKGLCDPDGDTPCCFDFRCQNKTRQQCTCANCEDMRTPIHAEYATWRPVNPSCQPRNWSQKDICRLLQGSSIYFAGDSLVRHVYTAFVMLIQGNSTGIVFKGKANKQIRAQCAGLNMFLEKLCRGWLKRTVRVCGGTVNIKHMKAFYLTRDSRVVHGLVRELAGRPRSLLFFEVGVHDRLTVSLVKSLLLQPLLELRRSQNLAWPHLLWATVHKFGMMKPLKAYLNDKAVRAFNKDINAFLADNQVAVFDTYNLTHNLMSFDGTHYGYGANAMKVNILLHYIEELRSLGKW